MLPSIPTAFPAKFAEPRNRFDNAIRAERMEAQIVVVSVVICEAFPRAFLAFVGPFPMKNSVFIKGHSSRVFFATFGAFEWLFDSRFEVKFLKAMGSQVFPSQVHELLSRCGAAVGAEGTNQDFFGQLHQLVLSELGHTVTNFTAVFATDFGLGMDGIHMLF